MTICVISKDGKPLMPTCNIRKVRKMLKKKKAVIYGHEPFTIKLNYDIPDAETQPVEISVDTGYQYIGISVKSEKHEFISEERKVLSDEKKKHMAQKRTRKGRRNRLRYRKPLKELEYQSYKFDITQLTKK